ncbi:MAG: hypothetical protein KatS3mg108_1920 [Isosphaeraceae bacterium]|jgi:hypothetical protein|nr:MAG: hypothetical protein KatS3mg108_1920 [Isosphaeraceae bacterium]
MLCPPHRPAPVVENWLERHKHPVSFLLHLIGIPMTIVGVLLLPIYAALASWTVFRFAAGLFIGGYVLQLLGHIVDRSVPGEWMAIRRLIGQRSRRSD